MSGMKPRLEQSAGTVIASDAVISPISGLTAMYLQINYTVLTVKLVALTSLKPVHLKERLIKTN